MNSKPNKEQLLERFLVDLISAGLSGDSGKVELAAISLSRALKNTSPTTSKKINNAVSAFSLNGGAVLRGGASNTPLPVDRDSNLEMATITAPNTELYLPPVLTDQKLSLINSFLSERQNIDRLLDQGIRPSTSMLLIGQPGTGKTMLARYIASKLNKDLIVLDLSASISSLMGKTGANLKRVLQYAKQHASVLLFDEFDAIAKKRDDNTDLGEIKRVVNVLLMELEDWPVSSIFIATSNHPELLDKAIWRRFDHTITLDNPEFEERLKLLNIELGNFIQERSEDNGLLKVLSESLEDQSAAEVCKFANKVKRKVILEDLTVAKASFQELSYLLSDKKDKGRLCILAKKWLGSNITVRELAELTGLSVSGVQHHLEKLKEHA